MARLPLVDRGPAGPIVRKLQRQNATLKTRSAQLFGLWSRDHGGSLFGPATSGSFDERPDHTSHLHSLLGEPRRWLALLGESFRLASRSGATPLTQGNWVAFHGKAVRTKCHFRVKVGRKSAASARSALGGRADRIDRTRQPSYDRARQGTPWFTFGCFLRASVR